MQGAQEVEVAMLGLMDRHLALDLGQQCNCALETVEGLCQGLCDLGLDGARVDIEVRRDVWPELVRAATQAMSRLDARVSSGEQRAIEGREHVSPNLVAFERPRQEIAPADEVLERVVIQRVGHRDRVATPNARGQRVHDPVLQDRRVMRPRPVGRRALEGRANRRIGELAR